MGLALKKKDKIVLMLGRVTIQKGPDYFVEAAKKVLRFEPAVNHEKIPVDFGN